jgi:hypothetical protein
LRASATAGTPAPMATFAYSIVALFAVQRPTRDARWGGGGTRLATTRESTRDVA